MGTGAYENASPAAAVVDTAPTPTPAGELTATALLQKVAATARGVMSSNVVSELVTSGISVGAANTITNPLDVVKVRLQLVKQRPPQLDAAAAAAPGRAPPPPGLLATGVSIVRHEGVLALWSGLGPSLARGLFFGGARLGLYTPIKALVVGDVGIINSSSSSTTSGIRPSSSTKSAAAASLELKVLAGSLSGGLAAAVTSPIELIKTRLQAAGAQRGAAVLSSGATAKAVAKAAATAAPGGIVAGCPAAPAASAAAAAHSLPPPPPTSSIGVIRAVIKADGVAGLWRGALPGLVRSAILTAAQCATYDEVKRGLSAATGLGDGLTLHFGSSMVAGLVTTTVTNPLDVVKTRMFVGGKTYSGMLACAADVLRRDGPGGFMRGWSASYARLGPHTVIMFLAAEKLRKLAGLQSL